MAAGGAWLSTLTAVATAISWGFANPLVAQAATSRLLFAMARDRQLPSFLRRVHPTGQFFTWWDYRQLAFPKNKGLRIDHILCSPALAAQVKAVSVDRDERKGKEPSDHAPVIAEIDA